MKVTAILLFTIVASLLFKPDIHMGIQRESTIDSLGACQGVSIQHGKAFFYGDREVGMIRQFSFDKDTLVYDHKECKLTVAGKNVINHPIGVAYHDGLPVFIGNSVKPPKGRDRVESPDLLYQLERFVENRNTGRKPPPND